MSSVQLCIDTGPQTDTPLNPTDGAVTVAGASVSELIEPAASGAGNSTGRPAYSTPAKLLTATHTGETAKSDCLGPSGLPAPPIIPGGYLVLRVNMAYTAARPRRKQRRGADQLRVVRTRSTTYTP